MAPNDSACTFRKGFGLKADVQDDARRRLLRATRRSAADAGLHAHGRRRDASASRASSASATASSARSTTPTRRARKFPDRRIFLVGEIIHNPHVNARCARWASRSSSASATSGFDYDAITPRGRRDPAGVRRHRSTTSQTLRELRLRAGRHDVRLGAQRLEARRGATRATGFTSLIHGKYYHEETRATASQAQKYPDGALPRGARHGRGASSSATTSKGEAIAARFLRPLRARRVAGLRSRRASAAHRRREPDDDAGARVARDRRGGRRRDRARARRRRARRRLPHLRHDLQRDAGPAGRGGGAARASRST